MKLYAISRTVEDDVRYVGHVETEQDVQNLIREHQAYYEYGRQFTYVTSESTICIATVAE